MKTADTIPEEQIRELRDEAIWRGDHSLVQTCDRALDMPSLVDSGAPASHREMNGDARKHAREARQACADIINARARMWQWILNGEQAKIVYDALGAYTSDDNDAPHAEIAELRERLVRMGAVAR